MKITYSSTHTICMYILSLCVFGCVHVYAHMCVLVVLFGSVNENTIGCFSNTGGD